MQEIALFPLPETVVFPGMSIPLHIFEERYKKMVRDYVDENQRRFVITLMRSTAKISDNEAAVHDIGSFVDILSVSENPNGSYDILAHGQERCKVEVVKSEPVEEPGGKTSYLLYCKDEAYPLERTDPNLERVAAWDTLETFREYARAFFTGEAVKQVETSLPDDLVYQASFICANIRVPTASRQVMLEAPTLGERFQVAQKLMQELLESPRTAT